MQRLKPNQFYMAWLHAYDAQGRFDVRLCETEMGRVRARDAADRPMDMMRDMFGRKPTPKAVLKGKQIGEPDTLGRAPKAKRVSFADVSGAVTDAALQDKTRQMRSSTAIQATAGGSGGRT